jgi:hypothetical protein
MSDELKHLRAASPGPTQSVKLYFLNNAVAIGDVDGIFKMGGRF